MNFRYLILLTCILIIGCTNQIVVSINEQPIYDPSGRLRQGEVVDADLKIDTYRASGAGGQHVNKTESAIRITHIPTGLVVTCQDETSQHKNKAAALKVLRSRLLAAEQDKIAKERAAARKNMVSTGDRSAKIRTYNFPQGRVTDHRINFTAYNLEVVMNGQIDLIIENLKLADQQAQLASFVDDHE